MTTTTEKERAAAERARGLERGELLPDHTRDDEGHNGWSNRETWAVALHLGNEQGVDEEVRHVVTFAYSNALDTAADDWPDMDEESHARIALGQAAKALADWVRDDLLHDGESGYLTERDTVTWLRDVGSLWRVNWEAVTAHYLEEA